MATRRWTELGLWAGVVIALAACGSDDGDASTSTTPSVETTVARSTSTSLVPPTAAPDTTPAAGADGIDACAILESLDPAALLGEPAGAPQGSGSAGLGFSCAIQSASEDTRGATRLTITTNSAAENFEQQKELFGVDTEVDGLGDAAFHSGPYVFVLDGETFFFIQVVRDSSLGVAIEDAELEAAADTVLDALRG